MRSLGLIVGCALALGLSLAPRAADASVLRALTLEELCTRADRIVLGRVDKIESRWTDDRTAIYSEVTITVARAYKGATGPGEQLVVRKEGGSVAGMGMRVYGAPEFRVGEEALIFTEPRGSARFVSGMTQGKLGVLRAASGVDEITGGAAGAMFLGAPDERLVRRQPLFTFEQELVKVLDQLKVRK